MDAIYYEKQEGQLCAQHCLNNLLQRPIFDAVQLAVIANKLDEEEKTHLASNVDISTQELNKIIQAPSKNMDDSGFFSVQVITEALKKWSLEIHQISSPRMKHVLSNPVDQKAFICNYELHWLTIRKLGHQWFNLNSLNETGPEYITDTYLSLFLTQLQVEGYFIFVVTGILPPCEADELFSLVPYESKPTSSKGMIPSSSKSPRANLKYDDDDELATAIALSLSETNEPPNEAEQLRQLRLKHFDKNK